MPLPIYAFAFASLCIAQPLPGTAPLTRQDDIASSMISGIDAYLTRDAASPIEFRHWVANEYDPEIIARAFHEDRLASFYVDKILRRE